VISYPLAIVNAFVAAGLLYLYLPNSKIEWSPPFRASWPVALLFLLSNIYLVIAPFIPPNDGQNVYESLPYYLHCVVGMGIIAAGGVYWLIWAIVLPRVGKYEFVRETKVDAVAGWERNVFSRRKL
jgi:Amino acid permease